MGLTAIIGIGIVGVVGLLAYDHYKKQQEVNAQNAAEQVLVTSSAANLVGGETPLAPDISGETFGQIPYYYGGPSLGVQ